MLLLSFSIAYTGGCEGRGWGAARPSDRSVSLPPGLELTFYSGVYGTCIGAMTQFGHDAKSLIGISGICIGVGEILGEWDSSDSWKPASAFITPAFHPSDQEAAFLGC